MPDLPVAYFLTFRCYGTWLPGDERGSVSWRANGYRDPYDEANPLLERKASERANEPALLSVEARASVEGTIREVAAYRGWILWAANVRSNHVHVVVGTPERPEPVMNAIKAWSTRRLREAGLIPDGTKVWGKHGSTRYVWTTAELERVCHYVLYGQDKEGIEGY